MSEPVGEGALTLAVDVEAGPLHRVGGDVLVVPFFEDARPLRGPAGLADWRLCGLLSERLAEGALHGAPGEAALLPGGGPLRAGRCLALGLGPRARFGASRLREAAAGVAERLRALRAGVAVLGLAGEATWGLATDRAAAAAVSGLAGALVSAPVPLRLRLVVAEGELLAARRGVEEAARAAPPEVAVRVARDASAGAGAPRAAGTPDRAGGGAVRPAGSAGRVRAP